MPNFESFDISNMLRGAAYKLLASTIMPRPIAWVTTRTPEGHTNAAPFSFFNIVSADPPLVAISFSEAPDRQGKDTLTHIGETQEFVVHMVSYDLAEAMNITATNAPRGIDETKLAGLTLVPSAQIQTQRIAEAPVAFECTHYQTLKPGKTSTIVLGQIVHAHVREDAFIDKEKLYIDPLKLDLIGRMHGVGGYCTTREIFNIDRLSWPLEK